jgi:hypothetical protein
MAARPDLEQLTVSGSTSAGSENGIDQLLDSLRCELHAAVDEILNRLVGPRATAEQLDEDGPEIRPADIFGVWRYRWPDGQEEEFSSGRWFAVGAGPDPLRLRLAWTTRRAWGRDRERAIVFQQVGGTDSLTYYPLAEFVESDRAGQFASSIPNPARPRALLSAGSEIPERFRGASVVRADEAFTSIERGPSLRLIVSQDDEIAMVRHAFWVGSVRGRI